MFWEREFIKGKSLGKKCWEREFNKEKFWEGATNTRMAAFFFLISTNLLLCDD